MTNFEFGATSEAKLPISVVVTKNDGTTEQKEQEIIIIKNF